MQARLHLRQGWSAPVWYGVPHPHSWGSQPRLRGVHRHATPEPDPGNAGGGKQMTTKTNGPIALAALPEHPKSTRVHVEQGGLSVPFRRIELAGGNPPLDVYDTAGPLHTDYAAGLPGLRTPWIERRRA